MKKCPRLERSFRWLLHLIRNCQLPRYVRSKVRGHKEAVHSLENSTRRFVFMPKFSGDLRNILNIASKNRRHVSRFTSEYRGRMERLIF